MGVLCIYQKEGYLWNQLCFFVFFIRYWESTREIIMAKSLISFPSLLIQEYNHDSFLTMTLGTITFLCFPYRKLILQLLR